MKALQCLMYSGKLTEFWTWPVPLALAIDQYPETATITHISIRLTCFNCKNLMGLNSFHFSFKSQKRPAYSKYDINFKINYDKQCHQLGKTKLILPFAIVPALCRSFRFQ